MRTMIFAAMAASMMASPAMAQDRVFDFMGADTETVMSPPTVNGKVCANNGDGEASCTFYDAKLGNANALVMVNFYNGKLSSALGVADRNQFLSLLSAFTAKYGEPKMETRKWQNRAGATLDNSVAVWSFKGGNLELAQIGSRSSNTDFQFFSTLNAPPTEEPEVNF